MTAGPGPGRGADRGGAAMGSHSAPEVVRHGGRHGRSMGGDGGAGGGGGGHVGVLDAETNSSSNLTSA